MMEFLTPEQKLLVTLSRVSLSSAQISNLEILLVQNIDWSKVYDLSIRHGVTPLVYQSLAKSKHLQNVPEDIRNQFRNTSLQNLARNMKRYTELEEILKKFESNGVRIVILKGAALAKNVYGDIGLRVFGDIDLLVNRDSLSTAISTMRDAGFALIPGHYPVPDHLNEELGCEWSFYNEDTVIEIHWNLIDTLAPFNLDPQELFRDAVSLQLDSMESLSLSPEYELLHLCIHQFKHHWDRLRDLCDINELIISHQNKFDWDKILEISRKANADKSVFFTLLLTKRIMDAPIPETALRNLCQRVNPGKLSWSLYRLIESNILAFEAPHGFWPVILVDGFSNKMKIVLDTIKSQDNSDQADKPLDSKKNSQSPIRTFADTFHSILAYRKLLGQLTMLVVGSLTGKKRNIF